VNGPDRRVYTGRSTEAEPETDDPAEPSLRKAIRAAHANAKALRGDRGSITYRVVDIRIEGNNPITDYIVDIADA
jgi:hypothetical protein